MDKKFEIIVRDDTSALRLILPDEITNRIKEIISFNENRLKKLDNDTMMRVIIKSLDKYLIEQRKQEDKDLDDIFSHIDNLKKATQRGSLKLL